MKKVPSRGRARYKHAYNKGYRAGLANGERRALNVSASVSTANTSARQVTNLPTTEAMKWDGLLEVLNLIRGIQRA